MIDINFSLLDTDFHRSPQIQINRSDKEYISDIYFSLKSAIRIPKSAINNEVYR